MVYQSFRGGERQRFKGKVLSYLDALFLTILAVLFCDRSDKEGSLKGGCRVLPMLSMSGWVVEGSPELVMAFSRFVGGSPRPLSEYQSRESAPPTKCLFCLRR
jgi:hypothetical protein